MSIPLYAFLWNLRRFIEHRQFD